MIEHHEFDLVVVGAGGAGCTAAVIAAREGCSVALLSKEAIGGGNTKMSGGEIISSGVVEGDSPQVVKDDMIKGGEYLNDPELVALVAEGATSAIRFLESIGVFFRRDDEGGLSGRIADRLGGYSFNRSFVPMGSGMMFSNALRNVVSHEPSVTVFEDTLAVTLLKEGGEIGGVFALDLKTSKGIAFKSKATLLATGGCGLLYFPQTTNNKTATGEGYAMAFNAGARLVDMEMVQFFPFAMNHPTCLAGGLLDEPRLAGPRGKLINGLGEVIKERDINRMTRAQVTALMAKEISAGRATPWGGLKLDLSGNRDVPEMIEYKKMNDERKFFEKIRTGYGEKAFRWEEPWDVSPSAHYMMGGVKVDRQGQSTVRRLFAVGETAGGVMGANRLGATSLADAFTSGMRVGTAIAYFCRDSSHVRIPESLIDAAMNRLERQFGRTGKRRPIELVRELQAMMRSNVAIVRDEERLNFAITEIDRLDEELRNGVSISGIRRYNTELMDASELSGMLTTARLIAACALARKESRGAHIRLDYPEKDNEHWLKNISIWKEGEQIRMSLTDSASGKFLV